MAKTLEEFSADIKKFRDDRDWQQFHTLQNLIASVSIESAELLELTQWKNREEIEHLRDDEVKLAEIKAECADILIYLLFISDHCKFNLLEAATLKLEINAAKYPVEKSKGTATKYNKL